ncbi:MAG: hypothetical protein PHF67_04095 [Candidatus Nanoarchaeia archaeon]|nr:hypothetical protein [Candidatus Nanoarchaeia archaeon]
MEIRKQKNLLLFFIFFILINSVYSINGFGLSMIYNDKDMPLLMGLGETKYVDFTLLSSRLESDKKISLELIEGREIASLDKTEFYLPSDGEENGLIKITIPETEEKNEIPVRIRIKDISPSENSGTVGFSFSSEVSFVVKILENEKKLPENKINPYILLMFILILGASILIIFIYFLLKRRKHRGKSKKFKFKKIR